MFANCNFLMYLYCLFFTEVKGSTYTKDSAALTLKGIATIEHTIVICLTSAITAALLVFLMSLIDFVFGIGSRYVCLGLFVFFWVILVPYWFQSS